jgi:DNA-binding IclR family transcriptional regulator
MDDDETGHRTVKTAETTVRIVETVSELERASLTELADALDMHRSTLHAHLSTLVEQEYLRKDDTQYTLGLRLFTHGARAQRMTPFYGEAKQFLEQIAERTDEITWLVVEEHGRGVCLRKAKGELAVQPYKQLGARISLHDTAAGKAILSRLPREKTQAVIDRCGLPERTENTITSPEALFREVESARAEGVAFNDEESITGFRAVASPISSPHGQVGALVVSGPKNRLRGEKFSETIPEIVSGAANALELELSSEIE